MGEGTGYAGVFECALEKEGVVFVVFHQKNSAVICAG
jgi:hypothetical protein